MQSTQSAPDLIGRIPPPLRAAVQSYSAMLEKLAGVNLLGLTVYGPVLTPEFAIGQMAIANVILLDKIELGLLRRIAERGPEFGSRGIGEPLIMTPGFVRDSQDTFPLELLEIHQLRATIHGRDVFETIEIQPEHLRLQCEREFKRVLIRSRQAVLAAGAREEVLGEIEADIGIHLLRTLRGMLWLKGKKDYLSREQVIGHAEQALGGRLAGVREVVMSPGGLGWPEFQAFYADVEKLAERTNAL